MIGFSPLVLGLGLITLIAAGLGLALALAARRWPADTNSLPAQIDRLLPQTQCAQCGYPGCRPYAEAIAAGEAEINRCPPGGDTTTRALADLLGRQIVPLADDLSPSQPLLARIDEARCIGCALCLPACPVDAIVGAHGYLHTVLADECTGCELCVAPCPVDCIEMATIHRPLIALTQRPLPMRAV